MTDRLFVALVRGGFLAPLLQRQTEPRARPIEDAERPLDPLLVLVVGDRAETRARACPVSTPGARPTADAVAQPACATPQPEVLPERLHERLGGPAVGEGPYDRPATVPAPYDADRREPGVRIGVDVDRRTPALVIAVVVRAVP